MSHHAAICAAIDDDDALIDRVAIAIYASDGSTESHWESAPTDWPGGLQERYVDRVEYRRQARFVIAAMRAYFQQ